jgi:hypothetical protein
MSFRPTSVSVTLASDFSTTGNVTVSWVPASGTEGATYNIDRTNNGGAYFRVASGRASTSLSQTISPGFTSAWRVQAISPFTGATSSFTFSTAVSRASSPPTTVSLARVSGDTEAARASISVAWSSMFGATGYDVQERRDDGTWNTVSSNTSNTSNTYTGLVRGSTYSYRVRTRSAGGVSSYTQSGSLTLLPFKPASASASLSGETGIRLTWPAANGATGYDVDRRVDGGSYSRVTSNTTSRDITYSNLNRGSTYQFRVRSKNSAGDSPTFEESNSVQIPFPPPSAPSSASISKNKRDVTISLGTATAPTGTTISGYEIEIRQSGGSYGNRRSVSTSNRSTTYTGLNAGTTYQGRGRAIGTGGAGPWIESGTVSISPVPSAPSVSSTRNVRDIVVTSGVASSASDVTISEYTFQLRSSTDGGNTWSSWGSTRTTNTTQRTTTYTNLSPSTTYQSRARAESDFGSGAWGNSNIITLPPPPTAPATVSVSRLRRSVTATSSQSSVQDSSVVISGYRFQRRESVNGGLTWIVDWGNDITTGPTNRSVVFSDLNPNSTYQFRARAESNFGPSAYRNSATVLIPGLPDPPAQVFALQQGANIQTIIAPPIRDGGAPILTYTIQKRISENFGETWTDWTLAVVIPGNVNTFTFENLELQKTYQIRALATNEEGDSESFTESLPVYLPAIVEIYDNDNFRFTGDYKRYDENIGDWIGLSTYKRYINGQWVDLT